jgi:oxygen-independent coproporphyrinogen-3 oxidase
MGVQDLDPAVQRAIGRHQDVEATRAFVAAARALGFAQVNFDLIYGLPLQTPESWRRTLALVAELAPDRIAAYSFAYMPALRRQQSKLRVFDMATGPAKLRLLLDAQSALGEAGYRAIGMDHFARPQDELALAQARGGLQRNFQGYTVKAARDVVALGASAISDLGGRLYAQNARDLPAYYQAIEGGRLATARGQHLDQDDRRRRALIESLMCNFRVDLGAADRAAFTPELKALAPLQADGLVQLSDGRITVTPLGRLFVRNVAMVFDARRVAGGLQQASRTV